MSELQHEEPAELPELPDNCIHVRNGIYVVTFPHAGHEAELARFQAAYPELTYVIGGHMGYGPGGQNFEDAYLFVDKHGKRREQSLSGAFK